MAPGNRDHDKGIVPLWERKFQRSRAIMLLLMPQIHMDCGCRFEYDHGSIII